MTQAPIDRRRVRGDESRRVVLDHAVQSATVDGLDGLTIGRLADASGHSKSGIATLFGSKEQLQLAAVAAARDVFIDTVTTPARARTPRGLARVCALLTDWLTYSRERVFRGGCFFAAASVEFAAKPGAVRDAIVAADQEWEDYLTASLGHAMTARELPLLDDARQLTFEFVSLLESANTRSLLHESVEPYERAEIALRSRLLALGGDPALIETIGSTAA
ncbi:TetR/AcrR family transcriptional regulator [Microbacterium sp. NPDC058389]|uniref:TetR/AcrR family transcriptional regulator n=1 Tax=Microbacterium sp. NPDC058389 TaxID=3346475 RepID=UPI003661D3A4